MKLTDKEFIDLLEKQRRLELTIAKHLERTIGRMENSITRLMVHTITLDSLKHADILQALEDVAKERVFSYIEKYDVKMGLKKHLEEESEMLKGIEEIAGNAEDQNVKQILDQIVLEERRHHEWLEQFSKILEDIRGVSREDWWDYFNRWSNFST